MGRRLRSDGRGGYLGTGETHAWCGITATQPSGEPRVAALGRSLTQYTPTRTREGVRASNSSNTSRRKISRQYPFGVFSINADETANSGGEETHPDLDAGECWSQRINELRRGTACLVQHLLLLPHVL